MSIQFTACEHLTFAGTYQDSKRIQLNNGTVCWERCCGNEGASPPRLIQICTLKGKRTSATACTSAKLAECGDYSEITHAVSELSVT